MRPRRVVAHWTTTHDHFFLGKPQIVPEDLRGAEVPWALIRDLVAKHLHSLGFPEGMTCHEAEAERGALDPAVRAKTDEFLTPPKPVWFYRPLRDKPSA